MLTNKQKYFLRSKANKLKPVFQIGKAGLGENLITQLNDVLEKRELIKVNILETCPVDRSVVPDEVVKLTEADLVQKIGNIFILYKPSEKHPQFNLPK